ncbi:hypothetical protein [Halomarina rubra]|uniref:Uncharacterized protein n=1 Tax=Halomarina rubra TaxID=2071873 RepID=A0ABD6AQM0_9EURY|nr:hypothetical protein [Halomarina rubra]
MTAPVAGEALAAALPLVTGVELMVAGLLAFAVLGLPGIVVMLYFQRRRNG